MVTWHVVLDSVCDQGWMQVILEPFRSPACACGTSACGLSAADHSPASVSESSENCPATRKLGRLEFADLISLLWSVINPLVLELVRSVSIFE